jgi:hypothetical protein
VTFRSSVDDGITTTTIISSSADIVIIIIIAYANDLATERCTTSRTQVEKQKLESVENIPTFLRRSDIGQFMTCDELILPWRRRGGGSNHVWFVPG